MADNFKKLRNWVGKMRYVGKEQIKLEIHFSESFFEKITQDDAVVS